MRAGTRAQAQAPSPGLMVGAGRPEVAPVGPHVFGAETLAPIDAATLRVTFPPDGRRGESIAVRRGTVTLALVVCLAGCAGSGLLTGATGPCGWAGPTPVLHGVLLADREFGTVVRVETFDMTYPVGAPADGDIVPVMWPSGFTGNRLSSGEVEVRDLDGNVVAVTGGSVSLGAPGPRNVLGGLSYPADHGAFPTCGVI